MIDKIVELIDLQPQNSFDIYQLLGRPDYKNELSTEFSTRKSFYGKANIETFGKDSVLYSYGRPVAACIDNNYFNFGKYSTTTGTHQNEFLQQCKSSNSNLININPKNIDIQNLMKELDNFKNSSKKMSKDNIKASIQPDKSTTKVTPTINAR